MAVVDTRAGQLSWRTQAGSSATLTVVARDKDGAPVDLSSLVASITPRGGTAQDGTASDVTLGTRRWSWPGTVTSLVESAGSGRLSISDGDEWIVGTVWASLSGTASQQLVASVTVGQAVVELSAQLGGGGGGGGAVDSVDGRTGVVTLDDLYVGVSDPRLSDARTPTVHAGSHEAGGSDPLSAAAIGAATAAQGALADSAVQPGDIGWVEDTGLIGDDHIPSSIARDTEVTAAVTVHRTAVDPHGDRAYTDSRAQGHALMPASRVASGDTRWVGTSLTGNVSGTSVVAPARAAANQRRLRKGTITALEVGVQVSPGAGSIGDICCWATNPDGLPGALLWSQAVPLDATGDVVVTGLTLSIPSTGLYCVGLWSRSTNPGNVTLTGALSPDSIPVTASNTAPAGWAIRPSGSSIPADLSTWPVHSGSGIDVLGATGTAPLILARGTAA